MQIGVRLGNVPDFVCFVALRPKSTAMVIAGRFLTDSNYTIILNGSLQTSGQ